MSRTLSEIAPLMVDRGGAEAPLRSALSLVSSQPGAEFSAIVVLMRPGCIPQLFWSAVDQSAASMAATRVQMFANSVMAERMEEGGY